MRKATAKIATPTLSAHRWTGAGDHDDAFFYARLPHHPASSGSQPCARLARH
ncbi:MAG: hypothetical protein Q7P63_11940 [Verrucomicrobiota bacterium JB022]|nr:hypothetical protein [Verrucomicrobiota bacterium JB022]